jgi:uncharacterized protein involved in outer membrane biogenesis
MTPVNEEGRRMKWLKWGAIVLGVAVAALAAVPLFVNLDDYIPRIEKEASARLKEPVSIKAIRVSMLPLPHVTVDGIAVGKSGDVQVGKVTATPELLSLLGETKVVRSIEVHGLVLTQKAIDKIPAWAKGDGKPPAKGEPQRPAALRVERIVLEDALLKLDAASFGPFDARLSLNARGEPEQAEVTTRDGKLKARVTPEGGKYRIDVAARDWRLPAGPALQFDELTVKGVATLTDASLDQIGARLYGGSVGGKAALAWQKGLQVKGALEVSQLDIRPVLKALGRPDNVSGRLNAKPVFSANAASAAQLAGALRLETPFNVQNGVLHGVDIGKAATSLLSKEGTKGGETRFDQLSGHLALDRGTRRLTQLVVSSGALSATGNVTISPKDELSGRLDAKVATAKLGSASVPLNVAGTTQTPILYPSGSVLAGAAVGTAILGPGAGTTAGAKAGSFIGNLFGGGKEKK